MLRKNIAVLAVCLLLFLSFGEAEAKSNKLKGVLSYIVDPISSVKILPSTYPVKGKLFGGISIVAARGEYEPASFVLTPYSFSIDSLKIEPTELKGKYGTIPSSNVDIKAVKCWYQAGTAWIGIYSTDEIRKQKVLVPELLLNDDTLVKVDYKEEKNYLKLNFPKGDEYVWISDPDEDKNRWLEKWYDGWGKLLSVDKFPVKDSPKFLPINIPVKTNKQFWVTLKVPEDAKSGIYTGKINFSTPKQNLGNVNIRVRVLPFELSEPYYLSSIYYRGKPTLDKGTISCVYKSEKQYRKELENMFAHGVTNPMIRPAQDLGTVLKIREETGMSNSVIYYLSQVTLEELNRIQELGKTYGVSEVYTYGMDEAKGERQRSQRKNWEVLRKAGGKTFVSCHKGTFENIGDVLDLAIYAGHPSAVEAKKWHSIGHRIVCYANPQSGVENPAVYRRNFGLLLWQCDYDGAMDFAYQQTFYNIWNDFDHPNYRDHNFTYPTVDGVIDTIAWEGYREGVDDVRYLTTLTKAIKKAMESKNKNTRQEALKAQEYLDKLKKTGLAESNLDVIRLEITHYILKLKQEEKQ